MILDPLYLKGWDFTEYLIFTIFSWGVLARAKPGFFAAVFAVALVNRESALFIAAWLVISGLKGGVPGERRLRLALGLGLGLGGFALIQLSRWALWAGVRTAGAPIGNQLHLLDNLRMLAADFRSLNPESLFLLAVPALGLWLVRRRRELDSDSAALALTLAVIAGAGLCFASVTEARTWLVFVPIATALELQLQLAAESRSPQPAARPRSSGAR